MSAATMLSSPPVARTFKVGTGNLFFGLSVGFIALVAAAALLAPVLPIQSPTQLSFDAPMALPSAGHVLGTDASGRDILSRMIWGAQSALIAPLVIVAISTLLGTAIGLFAGWFGGWVDRVLTRVTDIVFAFPGLLIAIIAVAIFGKGVVAPVVAMCIAYSPYVARLVRNVVVSERTKPYIAAYRVQGFSSPFVALRALMPNIAPTISAQSAMNFAYAMLDLAALSFLGLGIQPPTPDWGAMVNDARTAMLDGHPLPAFIPAAAIVLTVVAFNIVGDHLADRFARRSA
ncbi:MAG TPA: ABC transporter permease [Microbacterium sp.]|uniref:ABC transporter permease n=1 Tax=Microbacterium sp. TaxID=51671 RepID=UPI002C1A3DDE|nr:ABC transporter permease [Microbacterium sp.]HWI30046.1 ABC transporter permease [Microbacterium sp.]